MCVLGVYDQIVQGSHKPTIIGYIDHGAWGNVARDAQRPMLSKKAKLYGDPKNKMYRCVKDPSNSLSDRKCGWDAYGSEKKAWKEVLKYADGKC